MFIVVGVSVLCVVLREGERKGRRLGGGQLGGGMRKEREMKVMQ